MKEFTKATIRDLRTEIETALEAVGGKHGIRFALGSGSFGPTQLSIKLNATLADPAAGQDLKKEKEIRFRALAPMFGLQPDDFGKTFRQGGRSYTIAGLDPKRPKNALMVTRDDGKDFIMPPSTALSALGRPAEAFRRLDEHRDLEAEARRENKWEARFS